MNSYSTKEDAPISELEYMTNLRKEITRLNAKHPSDLDLNEIFPSVVDNKNGHIVLSETFIYNQKTINLQEHFGELWSKIEEYVQKQNAIADRIKATTYQTSHPEIAMGAPDNYFIGAKLSWHALKAQLEASGAHITVLGKDDKQREFGIWPRDRYIATLNNVVNIYPQGRKTELEERSSDAQSKIKTELSKLGTPPVVSNGFLEGGDVLQHPKSNTVFVGVYIKEDKRHRTPSPMEHQDAANNLAKMLNMHLVTVPKLGDSVTVPKMGKDQNDMNLNYYHLDTFMSVLPDGGIILIPSATTPEAVEKIKQAADGDVLELPPGTTNIDTNLLTVNGNVFSAHYNEKIAEFLQERGYTYIVGNFQFMDSGPHCLTNFNGKQPVPDGRSDRVMNEKEQMEQSNLIATLNTSREAESLGTNNTPNPAQHHRNDETQEKQVVQLSLDPPYQNDLGLGADQLAFIQVRINEVMQNQSAIEI